MTATSGPSRVGAGRSEGSGLVVGGLESRLLVGYYLATPAFALADVLGVAPFRVAGLEGSGVRWGYYGVAFLLGLACRRWPAATPWVAMGESAVNLLLLLIAFLVPIWSLPEAVGSGAAVLDPVTSTDVLNLAVSGGALVLGFYGSQRRAMAAGLGPGVGGLGGGSDRLGS